MARPHPVLVTLARGDRPAALPAVDDGLLASAVDHGMHGLLWTEVRDDADRPGRVRLAGLDLATRSRHARLAATLADVRDRLRELDVEIATLKGVVAEARWYDRIGERPCHDVDVLVEPAARARAEEIVRHLQPGHPLLPVVGTLVRDGVLQSVTVGVRGVSVDLHFDLFKLGLPNRSRDAVWSRTEPWSLPDGTVVRMPDAATALVHFLVHANHDGFPRLLAHADVVRVGRDPALDRCWAAHLTRTEGLDVVVANAHAAVGADLGLALTPILAAPRGVRDRAWRRVWPPSARLLGSAGTARSRRQDLLPYFVRGRGADAVRATRRVAFPPGRAVALRYREVPGPYPWRLAVGRLRTARRRHAALRRRHTPPLPQHRPGPAAGPARGPGALDAATRAAVLRRRAARAPLWLTVRGDSMGWSVPEGTRVEVEVASGPRRGEVWAFCDARGAVVLHRSLGRGEEGLRFQGDARPFPDPPVPPDHLVGRAVAFDPVVPRWRRGPLAGAVQRLPRAAVARATRIVRRAAARRAAGP